MAKFPKISPHVKKFSISPQLSYMVSWNFSTRQFFLHEYNSDIRDKYQLCHIIKLTKQQWRLRLPSNAWSVSGLIKNGRWSLIEIVSETWMIWLWHQVLVLVISMAIIMATPFTIWQSLSIWQNQSVCWFCPPSSLLPTKSEHRKKPSANVSTISQQYLTFKQCNVLSLSNINFAG